MEKEWKETGERFFTQSPSPSVRSSVTNHLSPVRFRKIGKPKGLIASMPSALNSLKLIYI
jgi:hypothetical protein